jgi:hypothetical protein
MPPWMKDYMQSLEGEFQKEEDAMDLMDDHLKDNLIEEARPPLAMRLYAKIQEN